MEGVIKAILISVDELRGLSARKEEMEKMEEEEECFVIKRVYHGIIRVD